MPTLRVSMRPEGPKGCTASSRTSLPLGFDARLASTSTGFSVRASSWTLSTILPDFLKSVASILYLPRTSLKRMSTIEACDLPTHLSGVSRSEVSPYSWGRRGPMSTFGYP